MCALRSVSVEKVKKRESLFQRVNHAGQTFEIMVKYRDAEDTVHNILGISVKHWKINTLKNWPLTPLGKDILKVFNHPNYITYKKFLFMSNSEMTMTEDHTVNKICEGCIENGDEENIPTFTLCIWCDTRILSIGQNSSSYTFEACFNPEERHCVCKECQETLLEDFNIEGTMSYQRLADILISYSHSQDD